LRGKQPQTGRPGALLPPIDFEQTEETLERKTGHKITRSDLLSYLMYPDVFLKFSKARSAYGNLEVLPTPQFFYGLDKAEEVAVELEPGKTLVIKFLTASDPQPDATRTVFFELNGQPREVTIRDKALRAAEPARLKAEPGELGQVGAPIPGAISSIAVEVGQKVEKGDRLLVMEAMKMQSTIYAPIAGRIAKRLINIADKVESKDLLIVIEAS
jgi:pyruvate carboxylase